MLTDLQTRKLIRRFNVTDLDNNGVLEHADFKRFGKNLCTILGLGLDTPQYQEIAGLMETWWGQIAQSMDQDPDSQITLDEWLAFHEHAIEDGVFAPLVDSLTQGVFRYLDGDADGRISAAEFRIFFEAMEIDTQSADDVFHRLDGDSDGYLNAAEVVQRTEEFFASADPGAPGNWLFGAF